jgi:hypothetical protein
MLRIFVLRDEEVPFAPAGELPAHPAGATLLRRPFLTFLLLLSSPPFFGVQLREHNVSYENLATTTFPKTFLTALYTIVWKMAAEKWISKAQINCGQKPRQLSKFTA